MGAVNYFTSNYITLGFDCSLEYDGSDFDSVEDMDECREEDIYELRDKTQAILDKYRFCYFYVVIKSGYYEGFTIDIESNFPVCYDNYEDKRDAQKEITELKKCLLECTEIGLVKCRPSWCTGYSNKAETITAIRKAVKDMREEAWGTPTYNRYILKKGV